MSSFPLPDLDCKYGAPMGRARCVDDKAAKCRLFRVPLDSGGYDQGGAYWGIGKPLYCALGEDFQDFTRASDREEAKEIFQAKYPNLRFNRWNAPNDRRGR